MYQSLLYLYEEIVIVSKVLVLETLCLAEPFHMSNVSMLFGLAPLTYC
jgi:hypothetical protein